MFDTSIRSALLSCSTALSDRMHLPQERILLGFRPLHWHREGQLDRALGAFGLRRDDNLWVRGEGLDRHEYEHRLDEHPSALGYLTLGELDAWARSLCDRAATERVAIELPPLAQLMNADSTGVRLLIDALLETCPGLIVRFSSAGDARADAALGVAMGFLTEGSQLRLLAETMKHARTLDARSVPLLLSLAGEPTVRAHALRVLNVRLRRECGSLERALTELENA